jgi:hypothetical protein
MNVVMRTLCAASVAPLVGCASIVSHSSWNVTIDSNPMGAALVVRDGYGNSLQSGTAPLTLTLNSGDGYFGRARYSIDASLPGYSNSRTQFSASFNGWYVGNIVFGGLLGFLVIDPLTGAMWRLDDHVVVQLNKLAP